MPRLRRGGGPGVDGLLAGGDHVDAAGHALLHVVVDVIDETEEGDHGHIRVALVEDLVCVVGDDDAGLDAQTREVAHVLAHDRRVHVDGAHDLRAVLVEVAEDVLAHLAAAVLDNLDLLHGASLFGRAPTGLWSDYMPQIVRTRKKAAGVVSVAPSGEKRDVSGTVNGVTPTPRPHH